MLKVFGLLVLSGGLLIFVIGAAGAVMNFVFPPKEMSCTFADEAYAKAEKAVKDYQAAKGTSREIEKKLEADAALKESETWSDSCARSKDSHRFYGLVFIGVGILGGIVLFFGALLTFYGFRRKKAMA